MSRLSWDEYFIEITKLISKRSSCLSRQVGAIIVKDKRVLATGYNGSPKGIRGCCDKGYCIRKENKSGENLNQCYAVHAEQNAITQCAKNGISCENGTLYCTTYPCITCMKLIINSGIKEVVYLEDYNDALSKDLASVSDIIVRHYKNVITTP